MGIPSQRHRPDLTVFDQAVVCPECKSPARQRHCPNVHCIWLWCEDCRCTWDPLTDNHVIGAVG